MMNDGVRTAEDLASQILKDVYAHSIQSSVTLTELVTTRIQAALTAEREAGKLEGARLMQEAGKHRVNECALYPIIADAQKPFNDGVRACVVAIDALRPEDVVKG